MNHNAPDQVASATARSTDQATRALLSAHQALESIDLEDLERAFSRARASSPLTDPDPWAPLALPDQRLSLLFRWVVDTRRAFDELGTVTRRARR